jgi:hypothetical protein
MEVMLPLFHVDKGAELVRIWCKKHHNAAIERWAKQGFLCRTLMIIWIFIIHDSSTNLPE